MIARKIRLQRDGTEYSVANELVDLGVPREDILLGFQAPNKRPYMDFAAALGAHGLPRVSCDQSRLAFAVLVLPTNFMALATKAMGQVGVRT